jgi:hypothetical protein
VSYTNLEFGCKLSHTPSYLPCGMAVLKEQMRRKPIPLLLLVALTLLLVLGLASCKGRSGSTTVDTRAARSSSLRSPQCCAAYQGSDSLPDQPPSGVLRLAIGGDSRDDSAKVVPWAFQEAKRRGASAFLFLGDMEITRSEDFRLKSKLKDLGIPFYPAVGNHEIEFLGLVRLPGGKHPVKEFKEDFLQTPGIKFAPFMDRVVYSINLGNAIHFIALDNVSRRSEGFGGDQLDWLREDLKAARAENKLILVGMHKGLANNPVTRHSMDEDGESARQDSEAALAMFKQYEVAMVFVSHSHMYAAYSQQGVPVRLTGGLGAPLVKGLAEADGGFHHFLLLDVPPIGSQAPLRVQVVKFPGKPIHDDKDETLEVE